MQNYFNYFTEIEEHFQRRRGSLLMLSTLDWALIETWREAEVPLAAALRGIDTAFDKHDARKITGRARRINGLAWCTQEVMKAVEEMQEASVGAPAVARQSTSAPGLESERITDHLQNCAAALRAALLHDVASQIAVEIAIRLEILASDVQPDLETLERNLTVMEGKLFAALTTTTTEEELITMRTQAANELAPYRGRMKALQIRQIEEQFLHKRLLERWKLPRLSALLHERDMKLHIEKAVYGGSGLARISDGDIAGKTVFTPLTLPGEVVEAHTTEDKRSFLNAEVDAILQASPLRTTPACPYFGTCGGCSYQHAVYAHQVEIKAAILREALERARLPDLPPIQTVSGHHWNYRNRVRLHIQSAPLALAYRERRSNRMLAVDQCPIAAPLLEKAIVTVTEAGSTLAIAEFCEEIEFFSASEDSLLLSFFAKASGSSAKLRLAVICEALKKSLPQLSGAALFVTYGKQPAHLIQTWGEESLLYNAANFKYRVSLGSFFQINRYLVDALVDLATTGRSGRLAWDLYAGVGLFARALTQSFERVIAVEASPASVADLRHNLEGTSHRVVEAATLDFLQKQKSSSTPPNLVVVDPPRAGLGPTVTSALASIRPAEIVYVSCDPSTLSRDVAALVQSGYDLRTITMVDLFPQTFHLESVSVLTRR